MIPFKSAARLGLTILLIYAAYVTAAQEGPLNTGGPTASVFADTFLVEPVKTKIVLPVSIRGKQYKFLLDTGAPLMLSGELAAILRTGDVSRALMIDQSGKQDSISIILTDTIRIGRTDYVGVPAIVMQQMPPALACFGIDGIIGSNMLRQGTVYFDMSARQVIISRGMPVALSGVKAAPLKLDHQSNPFIHVQARKAGAHVLFDSGSDGFFEISEKTLQPWIKASGAMRVIREGFGATTIGFNGVQENTRQFVVEIRGLRIGRQKMDTVHAVTTSGDSRIGASLFSLGKIAIDYAGKRFYFAPYPRTAMDFREEKWEINGIPIAGKMRVMTIWNQQLADAEGIRLGDEILSINGRPAAEITLCELLQGKSLAGGDAITMRIRNSSGAVRDIRVRKSI